MTGVNPSISTSNAGFRFSKRNARDINVGWVSVCAVAHLKH
jgi:hypothetical protein